jgi:hypothetical protein
MKVDIESKTAVGHERELGVSEDHRELWIGEKERQGGRQREEIRRWREKETGGFFPHC